MMFPFHLIPLSLIALGSLVSEFGKTNFSLKTRENISNSKAMKNFVLFKNH